MAVTTASALLIDLSDCTYTDSWGLGEIMRRERIAATVGLPLEVACSPWGRTRKLCQAAPHIDPHMSREAARSALRAPPASYASEGTADALTTMPAVG